jgi:hypothetical protein
MKIGTLTFHRACNYGGALQCFALVKALRSMGYDAEVVDYRNPAIEKSYQLISTTSLKSFLSSLLYFRETLRKRKNFRTFCQQFIPTSKRVFKTVEELSNQYSLCFIGSDQVWSKRINRGFDPVYWGNFEGKKATYAASMGTDHNFTQNEYDEIKSYLTNFDYLSTREDSLRDEISPLTDKQVTTVVDPTLLLSVKDYEEFAIKPKEENYVLYYQMQYNPHSKDFVASIAKQLNCKVITLMGPNENYEGVEHIHKTLPQVNVPEFVGYILYAKCVIASSFHGTALPIAMRKDFYFLANSRVDRSANLLRYLGALDRMKDSSESVVFESVNYNKIESMLTKFVGESQTFIDNCVKHV